METKWLLPKENLLKNIDMFCFILIKEQKNVLKWKTSWFSWFIKCSSLFFRRTEEPFIHTHIHTKKQSEVSFHLKEQLTLVLGQLQLSCHSFIVEIIVSSYHRHHLVLVLCFSCLHLHCIILSHHAAILMDVVEVTGKTGWFKLRTCVTFDSSCFVLFLFLYITT